MRFYRGGLSHLLLTDEPMKHTQSSESNDWGFHVTCISVQTTFPPSWDFWLIIFKIYPPRGQPCGKNQIFHTNPRISFFRIIKPAPALDPGSILSTDWKFKLVNWAVDVPRFLREQSDFPKIFLWNLSISDSFLMTYTCSETCSMFSQWHSFKK